MSRISHFHAVVFADEPRNTRQPKMFRIDFFYRQPGLWRAQGLGHVKFKREERTWLFDTEKRKFIDPGESTRRQIIPDDFIRRFEADGLLNAMLFTLFRGEAPLASP